MTTQSFCVKFYKNNTLEKTIYDLDMSEAYTTAVPREAYEKINKNRWHLMLRHTALPRLSVLFVGETLRIAWEDESPDLDAHYVLIQRI